MTARMPIGSISVPVEDIVNKPKAFRVGDKVKVGTSWTGLVLEVSHNQGRFSYGVGGIWWYDHDELTLVSPATEKSELKAYRMKERA